MTLSWDELIALVASEVNRRLGHRKSGGFVLIDGFAATGKSKMSREVARSIATQDQPVEILCTDDFIKYERRERASGDPQYNDHKAWYNLNRLASLARLLKRVGPADIRMYGLYQHNSGLLDGEKRFNARLHMYIVVEGMYALQLKVAPAYRIALLAHHDVLLRRVTHRDSVERGIKPELSEERYWLHNGAVFQSALSNTLSGADLIVDTSDLATPMIVASQAEDVSWHNIRTRLAPYLPNDVPVSMTRH